MEYLKAFLFVFGLLMVVGGVPYVAYRTRVITGLIFIFVGIGIVYYVWQVMG